MKSISNFLNYGNVVTVFKCTFHVFYVLFFLHNLIYNWGPPYALKLKVMQIETLPQWTINEYT